MHLSKLTLAFPSRYSEEDFQRCSGNSKLNVNFTLEQAKKVQRGSTGIALLFIFGA